MIRHRSLRTFFAIVVISLATGPACVDFGIENETFICRSNTECGEGFECLRGPGGHCICKPFGSPADRGWEDPNCNDVAIQSGGLTVEELPNAL
jgi:hypothetical protein